MSPCSFPQNFDQINHHTYFTVEKLVQLPKRHTAGFGASMVKVYVIDQACHQSKNHLIPKKTSKFWDQLFDFDFFGCPCDPPKNQKKKTPHNWPHKKKKANVKSRQSDPNQETQAANMSNPTDPLESSVVFFWSEDEKSPTNQGSLYGCFQK